MYFFFFFEKEIEDAVSICEIMKYESVLIL